MPFFNFAKNNLITLEASEGCTAFFVCNKALDSRIIERFTKEPNAVLSYLESAVIEGLHGYSRLNSYQKTSLLLAFVETKLRLRVEQVKLTEFQKEIAELINKANLLNSTETSKCLSEILSERVVCLK